MTEYDAIIIGAGQAGPALAVRLAQSGLNTAIIERKLFGGTCVNTGCIPTKTLVASAYAAHMVQRSADYGVEVGGDVKVNMKKVKARKDEVANQSNQNVENWLKGTENLTVYENHAAFESANTLRVGEELLTAKKIFINVGARASTPDIKGLDQINYLNNSSMMEVDYIPEHLIIIGGSYIGLEFAQMYKRFGSEVTVIEKFPRLIGREDDDVSKAVCEILENEGINIRLNAECMEVGKENNKIIVNLDCESDERSVTGSHLLLAVGRQPNTDDLGLDNAGVECDLRNFINVDDQCRTSVRGVWAVGECNGRGAFTHTAYNDYEIVAANLLDKKRRKISDRSVCYGLFIDPPLARVGLTEREVFQTRRKALIGIRPMSRVGRAVEKGETQGFIKVLVDAETKLILGASILGMNGDEAIHCIIDMMYAKQPYTRLTHAVHIHPTVAELIPTVFGELKPLA